MFLIVFSLIVGFLGSVYAASYDQTTSARIVPTVLKVSGDLSLSNNCSQSGCYIKISVNNNSVVQTAPQTKADLNTQLASGIYTKVFGITTTGTSKTVPVKVSVYDGSTELISASTDISNPNYNMGPLTADYAQVANSVNNLTVVTTDLNTSNSPSTGNLLSYNGSTLSWLPFVAFTNNIADLSVKTSKLLDSSIISSKILDDSIRGVDIANNTIPLSKLKILSYYGEMTKNGIETAYSHCPDNGATLIFSDSTLYGANKKSLSGVHLIWWPHHKCGIDSLNLSLSPDIASDYIDQVATVTTIPSSAITTGNCTWKLDGSLNFTYERIDPLNRWCGAIRIPTSSLSKNVKHTLTISITNEGVTKTASDSFWVVNTIKPGPCVDSTGSAIVCPADYTSACQYQNDGHWICP